MTATEQPEPDMRLAIMCWRPGGHIWVGPILVTIICGVLLAGYWSPNENFHLLDSKNPFAPVVLGALWLVSMFIAAIHQLRARIVADDTRLYWRYWRYWHSVRWEDISDYYITALYRGGDVGLKIITRRKDFVFNEAVWANRAALRKVIQQLATRATAKMWEDRSKRSDVL